MDAAGVSEDVDLDPTAHAPKAHAVSKDIATECAMWRARMLAIPSEYRDCLTHRTRVNAASQFVTQCVGRHDDWTWPQLARAGASQNQDGGLRKPAGLRGHRMGCYGPAG